MDSVVDTIPAANDLNIELGTNRWRLLSTELATPTTLMEATPEGITAHPVFVEARDLPGTTFSPAQISRVVLGWAPENQAWRLGLLIQEAAAVMTDTTQLQWCELAAWTNHLESIQRVKLAAQSLARLIGRPFQLIEPETPSRIPLFNQDLRPAISLAETAVLDSRPILVDGEFLEARDEEFAAVSVLLPDIEPAALPIEFSEWRLKPAADGLRWRRSSTWWWLLVIRVLLFSALTALFLILSLGTQFSGFAEVEPTWLPWSGVVVASLLFLNLLYTFGRILNASGVMVDTFHREVYNMSSFFPFVNWRVSFDKVEYLLITQTPARAQGRPRRSDPMRIAQEIWLHICVGGKFYLMADLNTVEGKSWDWDTVKTQSMTMVRRNLQLAQYDTPAHHAALRIAEKLDIPVYIDIVAAQ